MPHLQKRFPLGQSVSLRHASTEPAKSTDGKPAVGPTPGPGSTIGDPAHSPAISPPALPRLLLIQDLYLPVPYVPHQVRVSLEAGFSSSAQCLVFPLSEVLQHGIHLVPDVLHGLQQNDPYVTVFSDRQARLQSGSPIAKLICVPGPTQDHDPLVAATFPVTEKRPKIQMTLGGRTIEGVLDTGADCSVIAIKDWPSAWPLEPASSVIGVGGAAAARRSRNPILIQGSQGFEMTILPLVLDIPVSLWGRDLLAAAETTISTNLC